MIRRASSKAASLRIASCASVQGASRRARPFDTSRTGCGPETALLTDVTSLDSLIVGGRQGPPVDGSEVRHLLPDRGEERVEHVDPLLAELLLDQRAHGGLSHLGEAL